VGGAHQDLVAHAQGILRRGASDVLTFHQVHIHQRQQRTGVLRSDESPVGAVVDRDTAEEFNAVAQGDSESTPLQE
jgi:hypothetical protein